MIWLLIAIDIAGIMAAAGLAYARPHDPVRVTPTVLACTLSMLIMGIVLSSNVLIVLVGSSWLSGRPV